MAALRSPSDTSSDPSKRPAPPPPSPRKPPTGPPGAPGPARFTPLWWLILVALGLWNMWAFFPRQTTEATLPYSEFVSQLRAGNVEQVHLSGDAISGSFQHPVVWPAPELE